MNYYIKTFGCQPRTNFLYAFGNFSAFSDDKKLVRDKMNVYEQKIFY
jgi:hypothetical protein